jgi:uncharacterized membrane protein YbaN (DUF454 family)
MTKPPSRRRRSKTHNLVYGTLFFLLGVVGLLIPVVPQVPFFVMSALFFSLVFPGVRRRLRRWRLKHPRLDASYRKWRGRARRKRHAAIRRLRELRSAHPGPSA